MSDRSEARRFYKALAAATDGLIYAQNHMGTVTAEVSRARDGSHAGLLRTMTLPGGKVISACPQNC